METARKRAIAALGGVFVFALALRLAGVSGVLPYIWHPDETHNFRVALRVARAPTVSPRSFSYPSLLFYTQAAMIRAEELVNGRRVRGVQVVSLANARTPEPTTFRLGRAVTALFSAATALLASVMVLDAGGTLAVSVIAGVSTALSPLSVEHGTYITPDTYASFFVMAALWASLRLSHRRELANYVLAGVCIGLAAGSKYNAALVAVAAVAAHCHREGFRRIFDKKLVVAAVVSVLAFVVSTPFSVLDYEGFLRGLAHEAEHYRTGHLGAEGASFIANLRALWLGCGPWVLFCIPAVPSLRERTRNLVVTVLPFSLLYLAFISAFPVHFDRNALPLVAPFITVGVVGAADVFRPSEEGGGARWWRRAGPVLLFTVFAGTALAHGLAVSRLLRAGRTNYRASAQRWIEKNVPRKAKVFVEAYGPWVDSRRYRVGSAPSVLDVPDRTLAKFDYVVMAEDIYGRFFAEEAAYPKECARYRAIMQRFCERARFQEIPGGGFRIHQVRCKEPAPPVPEPPVDLPTSADVDP